MVCHRFPKRLSCAHTCLVRGPHSPCTHLSWDQPFRPGPLFSEPLTLICFPGDHTCHLQNSPGTSAVLAPLALLSALQYPFCAGTPTWPRSPLCVRQTGLSSMAGGTEKERLQVDAWSEITGALPPLLTEMVTPERVKEEKR